MSKQNQNNTLQKALNKAKMSKRRKNLSQEDEQVQREKIKSNSKDANLDYCKKKEKNKEKEIR